MSLICVGMTTQGEQKYEMSLDDVRSYLLETGAIKEAEQILNVESKSADNELNGNPTDTYIKPADVYERITRRRENVRFLLHIWKHKSAFPININRSVKILCGN